MRNDDIMARAAPNQNRASSTSSTFHSATRNQLRHSLGKKFTSGLLSSGSLPNGDQTRLSTGIALDIPVVESTCNIDMFRLLMLVLSNSLIQIATIQQLFHDCVETHDSNGATR